MAHESGFTEAEMAAFKPAEKVGLVATINPQGLPHMTLITSIRANTASQMTLGEFCKGQSKHHMQHNPRTGFLIMTRDRRLWRGQACWTHLRTSGPEYEAYNDLPMFRYNTYFGIHTVHYLDLVRRFPPIHLPMAAVVRSALRTRFAKGAAWTRIVDPILKPFAQKLFNALGNLKFLTYVDGDGYPVIVPALQCQAADSRRLVFSLGAFGADLAAVPEDVTVAVLGLSMAMEDVLVRGRYKGLQRFRGVRLGVVDIDWVYNSMPPCHGQIYPPLALSPVTEF